MNTQAHALLAHMESLQTEVEAMKIANYSRQLYNESPAYNEQAFLQIADRLAEIAERLEML